MIYVAYYFYNIFSIFDPLLITSRGEATGTHLYCTIVHLRFVSRPTTVSTTAALPPSISFCPAYILLPWPQHHRRDSATDAKAPEGCGALASSVRRHLHSLSGRQRPFHVLFDTVKSWTPFSFGMRAFPFLSGATYLLNRHFAVIHMH
jgi:hypothetical protein